MLQQQTLPPPQQYGSPPPPSQSSGQPSPKRIMEMAWGFAAPLILEAAVRIKLFDAMYCGPMTLDDVARATRSSPRGLRAVLNALVGLELLDRHGDRYALTPESAAFLVTTRPSFQGGIFHHISRQLLPSWMPLEQIVRTGKPDHAVNQQNYGGEFFQQFVEDILPMSYAAARALAEHLDADLRSNAPVKVLDIAAGSGVWGIGLAQRSPSVQVTAIDWPAVTPVTRRVAARFGVGDRIHTVDGDLLEVDFGSGYRIATLGHILHSEGEPRSRRLLRKVFDALAPGGTIAIAEFTPNDDRTGPPSALIFAVNMLVNTDQGDTFTFPEVAAWLREAGFSGPRQLETPSVSPLILANKP